MKKSVILCMVAFVLISVFVGCSVKNSDVNENAETSSFSASKETTLPISTAENDTKADTTNTATVNTKENVYRIWNETTPNKSAQLIFCDLSTPKSSNDFSVYNDIRDKLIKKGIPPDEVQFIHDANTETKKAELFKKVRSGEVRVLYINQYTGIY